MMFHQPQYRANENVSVCCFAVVQLLPPSCFETLSTDPVTDFSQTVNDIVNVLDEYNTLKYAQIPNCHF